MFKILHVYILLSGHYFLLFEIILQDRVVSVNFYDELCFLQHTTPVVGRSETYLQHFHCDFVKFYCCLSKEIVEDIS